jgi:hypothetical protein
MATSTAFREEGDELERIPLASADGTTVLPAGGRGGDELERIPLASADGTRISPASCRHGERIKEDGNFWIVLAVRHPCSPTAV